MTQTTRALLKTNFATAATPTGSQFADAIDTALDGVSRTYTIVKVAPSGGDYTTITAAIAAITDATESKRYRIMVAPGTYANEPGALGSGLYMKDFVDIVGAGRDQVTVKGGAGAANSTIIVPANMTVEGISFVALDTAQYCVHIDTSQFMAFTARNCRFIHRDAHNVLGCGGRDGQLITFENCEILGTIGIHSDVATRRDGYPWRFIFKGCTGITQIVLEDDLEYNTNVVELSGCEIDTLSIHVVETYYTNNSGDILFNKGYKMASTTVTDAGNNRLGRLEMTANNVLTHTPTLPSISAYCVNVGGGAIAAGEAVALQADPSPYGANAATEPNNDLPSHNVALWSGSGILFGYAVDAMAAGAQGTVQHGGRPLAFADASGAAISFGDALDLNGTGHLVKHASGTIVAYARQALASGTGLIVLQRA